MHDYEKVRLSQGSQSCYTAAGTAEIEEIAEGMV